MRPRAPHLAQWTALSLLAVSAAGCEQARSSRADRRLDAAESRFDSLEARVGRLERALLADTVTVGDTTRRSPP